MCIATCCQSVSLLTPLRHKHCDLPVAPPPEHLHGQSDSSAGKNTMEAVTVVKERENKQLRWTTMKFGTRSVYKVPVTDP